MLRSSLEPMTQDAQKQVEGGKSLLAVDNLEVVLLRSRRDENHADEILLVRARVDLFVNVLQKLLNLLVGPDVLPLVIRHDVVALPKCFFDAVLVVLNPCHESPAVANEIYL